MLAFDHALDGIDREVGAVLCLGGGAAQVARILGILEALHERFEIGARKVIVSDRPLRFPGEAALRFRSAVLVS